MKDRSGRGRRARVRVTLAILLGGLLAGAGMAPAAAASCRDVTVVVSVDWSRARAEKVAGVVTRIQYPSSLELPADDRGSAKARATLLTGTSGGLFDAVRKDTDQDGRSDLVSVGLITAGIAPGPFVRLRFDCRAGAAAPAAADFSCAPDIADEAGSVPSSCSVALESD